MRFILNGIIAIFLISSVFAEDQIKKIIETNDISYVRSLMEESSQETKNKMLMYAVSAGQVKMVRLLLKEGANANSLFRGSSLLYLAVSQPNGFLKNREPKDMRSLAIFERDLTEIVRLLVEAGAELYSGSVSTPLLQTASYYGHLGIVKLLIGYGVDVNERNQRGWTALMSVSLGFLKEHKFWSTVAWKNRLEIAKILINYGADVNAVNAYGQTALMLAVNCYHRGDKTYCKHFDIAKLLIKYGADVKKKDNNGLSAIEYLKVSHRGSKSKADVMNLLKKRKTKLSV